MMTETVQYSYTLVEGNLYLIKMKSLPDFFIGLSLTDERSLKEKMDEVVTDHFLLANQPPSYLSNS